ncbi:MAG: carboxylesterase/lipase family protein [Deltaproteobacteria bacterium]|nr:carboxylesterase/lipase family protein [Deltaproteobacteria bacterium]
MTDSTKAIVTLTSGKLEGIEKKGLFTFKGIPYAEPPVGSKRWRPPEPVQAWADIRQAKTFAPVAPQNAGAVSIIDTAAETANQNEDCLYLNVWTPGLDDKKRPVMVWIHGGGFQGGAGSISRYTGKHLAARGDVVVVTINYRLGALGFLNLNEITGGQIPATGNEGLLDQTMALTWVRDNIAAFGGDPGNVTIFGESAGGMSVGILLAFPPARGLFHKAICQSGAASTVFSPSIAKRVAALFLEAAGLKATDPAALRSLAIDQMLAAQAILPQKTWRSELKITMPFSLVADGRVLPEMPLTAIAKGSSQSVPLLVGTTQEEWKLFGAMEPDLAQKEEADIMRRLGRIMPADAASVLYETYKTERGRRGESTAPAEIFSAIQTDRTFGIPACRLLEAQAKQNSNVFSYLFTWKSPALKGKLGACHALDIGFVFRTLDYVFTGKKPEAVTLSEKIQDAWIAFARTGNPACDSLGGWPPYGEKRETMFLGPECKIVREPFAEELRVWDRMSPEVLGML